MDVDVGAAAVAGLVGAVTMAVPVVVARAAGADLRLDMPAVWSAAARVPAGAAVAVGLLLHLVASLLVGLAYAVVADVAGIDDHLLAWGLAGGVLHWVVAGVAIVGVARAGGAGVDPGPYCARFGGVDVAVFLVAHLAYGAAFGVAYALLAGDGSELLT